ncbi:MAG: hypothetical protein AAGG51_15505 [Cyanobacteria bacterium P01_G01_bin.54]
MSFCPSKCLYRKKFWVASLVLLLNVIPQIGYAQPNLTIEPEQIKVSGTRRDRAITRQIIVPVLEGSPLLEAQSLDLYRTDEQFIFPASGQKVEPVKIESANEEKFIQFNLNFDLSEAEQSGEYKGKLLLIQGANYLTVPVTVTVKDPALFPILILLTGTSLGFGLYWYRKQDRWRDRLLFRAERLQAQSSELPEQFNIKIEKHIQQMKWACARTQLEKAKNAIEQAENLFDLWLEHRTDWLKQLDHINILKTEYIEDLPQHHQLKFTQKIDQLLSTAIHERNLQKLQEGLTSISVQVEQFLSYENKLKLIDDALEELNAQESHPLQSDIEVLHQEIRALDPDHPSIDDENLSQRLNSIIEQLNNEINAKGIIFKSGMNYPVNIGNAPLLTETSSQAVHSKTVFNAQRRLQLFSLISNSVSVVLLVWIGFHELYIDKPTFGANRWQDYFALIAWGFGAEASRNAINNISSPNFTTED